MSDVTKSFLTVLGGGSKELRKAHLSVLTANASPKIFKSYMSVLVLESTTPPPTPSPWSYWDGSSRIPLTFREAYGMSDGILYPHDP